MSLCNDIYTKCIKQESELNNICNEVLKGVHDKVLNKVKEKFNEKMANLENSISLLEKQTLMEYSTNSNNYLLWKKKIENLKLSFASLGSAIENNIQTQIKKLNNKLFYSIDNTSDSSNISYLTTEHDSLKNTLKYCKDIESQETIVMEELDNQQFSLNSVKTKVLSLFAKADFTNTVTQWMVRRGVTDKQIFLGLLILTILITIITYYYVKPWLRSLVR